MTYTMTVNGRYEITINTDSGTITGNTYNAREAIKDAFPGIRWDGTRKLWAMDSAAMANRIEEVHAWMTRVHKLSPVAAPAERPAAKATGVGTSKCPRCGTYCYGDCTN